MMTSKISRRYAVALFEIIQEGTALLPALKQAADLAANTEAIELLESSVYPESVKCSVFDKILSENGRDDIMNLVKLLVSRHKVSLLPEILEEVELLIAQAGSTVDAEVTSAVPLSKRVLVALSASLASQIGKKVSLTTHEDPSLIGGFVLCIGDRKIDCSVKSKLSGMKRAIIG